LDFLVCTRDSVGFQVPPHHKSGSEVKREKQKEPQKNESKYDNIAENITGDGL
jgi:hypothetical protein